MQIPWLWYLVLFIAGLVFGSFFNVAIHRWPKEDKREREWVKTPSHCPKCGARIRWYHNIPVFSWISLGGNCHDCKAPISIRYPAVELGTALLWLGTAWLVSRFGLSGMEPGEMSWWHVAFAICFASLYLLTVIIDFQTQLIPDEITVAHGVLAVAFILICFPQTYSAGWGGQLSASLEAAWQAGVGTFFSEVLLSSLIGALILSGFFTILWLFKGMGFGDVKLAVGMGILFGWKLVITAGFLGVLLGGAVASTLLIYLKATGKYEKRIPIPFGPYLAISSFICLFAGVELLKWYLGLFGLGSG